LNRRSGPHPAPLMGARSPAPRNLPLATCGPAADHPATLF
jgi:hypothetical protein